MSGPLDVKAIEAAARQAIVFRQHFPPRHEWSARSFFGGAPIAPPGFRWPRPENGGAPLSFIMQIDCAAIPAAARLELLPDRGVLYFFLDLTWGQTDNFRVLYEEGGDEAWGPVDPPEDLGPAFGDQAVFLWKWTVSAMDCPTLLPKWTFDPVAIEIPPDAYDAARDDDADAPLFWPGEMAEALRAAQGADVVFHPFSVEDLIDAQGALVRPFAEYPHDWRAVQILAGLLLQNMRRAHRSPAIAALPEPERAAFVTRIENQAKLWYGLAASDDPFAKVPQPDRDRFWSWLADKVWLVRFVFGDALTLSMEASLSDSPKGAARIPYDIARPIHARHALASRADQGLFVTTPDRMLAPPVDVQGNQWERAKTHLLLLELSSNEGLGHHFGEGVYQFWIAPDDLRARRFDRTELTTDAS